MKFFSKGNALLGCAITTTAALSGCASMTDTAPSTAGPSKTDNVHIVTKTDEYAYAGTEVEERNNVQVVAQAPQQTPPPKKEQHSSAQQKAPPAEERAGGLVWTSVALPTGDPKTSVIRVEKGLPREVRAGQAFDYDIIVTNLTSRQVDDVVVTDQISNNYKFAKSNPDGQMNAAGVTTWTIGDLGPGESRTIRVTGAASGEGNITSCATCTYSSMLCAAVPVVSPKLRLTKTGPAEVNKCDPITYNFEVANIGTGAINNVKITDKLEEGLALADGKKTIEFNVGTLAAGEAKKFSASVIAAKAGEYGNTASASAEGMTADSSMVSTVVHQPVLTVDVECPQETLIGRDLTFKYTVKSTGDTDSATTTLVANLPAGTSVKADANGTVSGNKVTWNLGALKPNDSRTVTVTMRPTVAGALQTSASAQGACATAVTDSCSITIIGVPDIGTALSDDDGVVLVGDNHTFSYEVENQGQVDLTNVTVRLSLSDGLQYVSTTAASQPKSSGKTVEINLGTVKPGQKVSFNVVAKGTAAGEQGIDSETRSDQLKRVVKNDEQVTYIDR